MNGKVWMLMDGRYPTDPDRAICYETCETEAEARRALKWWPDDTVIVETEWEDADDQRERNA